MEMYASGEIGKMLIDGAKIGLDNVIFKYGSPIYQAGYFRYRDNILLSSMESKAQKILEDIKDKKFAEWFDIEADKGSPLVKLAKKVL